MFALRRQRGCGSMGWLDPSLLPCRLGGAAEPLSPRPLRRNYFFLAAFFAVFFAAFFFAGITSPPSLR